MSTLLLRGLSLYLGDPAIRSFYPEYIYWGVDPLNKFINIFFFSRFNPILASNLLAILYLLVTFIISFILFRYLVPEDFNKLLFARISLKDMISGFFAMFFSFSPYFLFRISSLTFNLYSIFFFPLTLYFLVKRDRSKVSPLFFIALLSFFIIYSSYYAYLASVLIMFWIIAENILSKSLKNLRASLIYILKIFMPLIIISFLVFGNLIFSNVPIFTDYSRNNLTPDPIAETLYRPVEDYYNFSFRPWYFLIPPKTSLLFSDLSKKLYSYLESTNYYLASNYDNSEAGGSYLGWHLIVGYIFSLLVGLDTIRKKFPKLEVFENLISNRYFIRKLFIVSVLILLISHPPSFTIAGLEIYTPSYLLYKVLPFFRVLVRWSVVIYLIILCANFYLVLDFSKFIKKDIFKVAFFIIFAFIHFSLMAIKLPLIDFWKIPPEILYLSRATRDEKVNFIVYPEGDFYSVFWTLRHKNYFYNVPQIKTKDYKPDEFSEALLTPEGLSEIKSKNIKYIIYYKDKENKYLPVENIPNVSEVSTFIESNFGNVVYSDGSVEIFERSL